MGMSSDSLDPRRPCHRLRVNLKVCLLQTDCCRIEKKTPKECLIENHSSIPEECHVLRLAFFSAKDQFWICEHGSEVEKEILTNSDYKKKTHIKYGIFENS